MLARKSATTIIKINRSYTTLQYTTSFEKLKNVHENLDLFKIHFWVSLN